MRNKRHWAVLLMGSIALLAGCVREATHQELTDLSLQYQANTLPTVVYYTGSDDAFDYFYLNVPFGQNDACKVPFLETGITNRIPRNSPRAQWRIYQSSPVRPVTNKVEFLPDGRIVVPF